MQTAQLAQAQEEYIRTMRRYFHQHPELSWEETDTTEAIARELSDLGIETRRFEGYTGIVGILHGTKPVEQEKTVLLRADIDALPIEEKTGLPFASQNVGVMHACGHDGHTAMLLGAARLLSGLKHQYGGEIHLLFQCAEEVNGGALASIGQGVLDKVDAVFGMHLWGGFDSPLMSIEPGVRMASCDNFTITVNGLAAHGSAPHQGVDAIVAAAGIVLQAQTLVSRNNDPRNPLVMTIGKIEGGKRFNIIADRVEMVGSVRCHSSAVRKNVEGMLRRVVEHTAAAYGATAELHYEYLAPMVQNDPALVALARGAAVKLYGEQALGVLPPLMSSEDFAFYMEKVPSVFCFLGAQNSTLGYMAANHNDTFTVDEAALVRGTALYTQFALDYLQA